MTALTLQPSHSIALTERAPQLMGAGLPPVLRTTGALLALLLAVAVTGVLLVAFALVMPFALIAALVMRRWQPRQERSGWRAAPA